MNIFAQPAALVLIAVLPALWLLGRIATRERDRALSSFGDPALLGRTSTLPGPVPRWRQALRWIAFAAAILALARPQIGRHAASLSRTGRDIIIALDLSRSMKVADVSGGTRLQLAKELAWQLAASRPGDRIGLVIFGGSAFLQLPPTAELGTLRQFLDAATPDDIADPATDISSALRVSERALRREGTLLGSRAVLLLSDGERSEGELPPVLQLLRTARLPVFAIGIGTEAGARVPADSGAEEGAWHLDGIGRPVVSRLNEGDLKRIADASNAAYARWDDATAMQSLADALGNLEARTLATQASTEPIERYQWPLLLAVLALTLELLLVQPVRRPLPAPARTASTVVARATRSAAAVLGLFLLGSCGGGGRAQLVRGQQLYESGKYREAFESYQAVLLQQGGPEIKYNSGNALYRMSQYRDAAQTWRDALNGSDQLRERAYFNMGNAYVRAAEDANEMSDYLGRAVQAYEEALKLDPNDVDAKYNLELALRKRGDTRSGGSPGRGGRADFGRGNMREEGLDANTATAVGAMAGGGQGGDEGESVEELNEAEARSLLEAVERQQLSSHQGQRPKKGPGANRDW